MFATFRFAAALLGAALVLPKAALAADLPLDTGNTAWVLTASALVLFMTLPGLALFYGGLVRAANVLSVLMQTMSIACVASILWLVAGYSLAFGDGGGANDYIGNFSKIFLAGVGVETLSNGIPESAFFMFQMTFAAITPALIVGAYVERMKFAAVLLFTAIWHFVVYAPVAHWVWGGGFLTQMGAWDFAGGLAVHVVAGTSGLVLAILLGPRRGFPGELTTPHNPGLTMIGGAFLWVGWFGFNAGSALAANGVAGMAMVVTHLAAASAALVWVALEAMKFGKPSLVGLVTGSVAGLVAITPAAGFVGPVGGLFIGLVAGLVCYFAVGLIKKGFGVDDSLDVFAVHGVGGLVGTLLTAVFGAASLGGVGYGEGGSFIDKLGVQVLGAAVVVIWVAIATLVVGLVVKALVGLRVEPEIETEGLDLAVHGERGYSL